MADDTQTIEQAMKALKSETPRITDAIKNLCSILAAVDLARGDKRQPKQPPHEISMLLDIAKVVLACINAHELVSPDEWVQRHTQLESETASDRIAITQYRACHVLRALAAAVPNAKITKLFGRGFINGTRCWSDIDISSRQKLAANPKFAGSEHTITAFLDGWAKSIASERGGGDGSDEDYSGLIWAADFNAALQVQKKI